MQQKVRVARLVDEPLSVDRVLAAIRDPAIGGIVVFIGAVRDHDRPAGTDPAGADDDTDAERAVTSLDYTAHPLALDRLQEVAGRAAAVDGVHAVAVEHRVGHLEVGDLAVVIAVGAAHRAEAFTGCRQLIDELKSGVPIWKEQTFIDGVSEWVGLP
ncbi:molybdenum cofactor biosynthesis protein MoaE [Microlunatus sp. Gsoil 973]|jgi:molybdopterin synthase catalytic subunit|uniref:molybdenum cofactor biosynthesis protein MoaE n=1 Tax=Microlunatus sp. Gsoil 973 TaxID=2672569 RepID=UPI0012B45F0C|nr:molybdenum cofactor biosynthesis protein MoaE [Microlunatus sp. Gsoil 973]QGN32211.1 molybdenum cofactor biosynthesis protein MoaE [Microlunatus sp. Gsoil 973]